MRDESRELAPAHSGVVRANGPAHVPASGASQEARRIAGNCYYETTVERGPDLPALQESCEVDVGIVGGGFTGLSTALELAERGYRVALLEAGRIASGASGRNGGQILPGFSCAVETIARDLGPERAAQAFGWSIEGMRIVKERAAAIEGGCDFRAGWLLLAARASHVGDLRDWYRTLADELDYGDHIDFVEGSETRDWTASHAYHAALIDRFAGHINPLKLALGMRRAALERGVRIFENSPVSSVVPGSTVTLNTAHGSVRCRHAVLAANVFIDGISVGGSHQPIARRIQPVGNTIIATECLDPALAENLLRDRFAACDTNFLLDYYRVTPDYRLLFGGGSTYMRHDSPSRVAALTAKMKRLYPMLASARIEYSWGGLIDVTVSRAPDFGRLDTNLYYLQGFSGHGVNVTALAGRVVAEAIHGDDARLALLSRIHHRRFPGGPVLRRSALTLGTWYYRARDWLAQ